MSTANPAPLMRSRHVTYFVQHGTIYAYHNLFGYIIAMSPDLAAFLEFHNRTAVGGASRTREEADARFGKAGQGEWDVAQLEEFTTVFRLFSCLVESDEAEATSVFAMVPVRSRWLVFYAPSPSEVTLWRTDREGRTLIDPLVPWASRLFLRLDGAATLSELTDELLADPDIASSLTALGDPREQVRREVQRWTHSSQQYCKLSKVPLAKFGKEHQWPSYLKSTMPYRPWDPAKDPGPVDALEPIGVPLNPPHEYYETEVRDAAEQFASVETTLSHLFRVPHPLLGNASYGERLADAFWMRGLFGPHVRRIVEVGGGLGHLAATLLTDLRTRAPELYEHVSYTIVDLSPALREAQKQTLAEAGVLERVAWRPGNAETMDFEPGSIDLLVSNEVVGDFTTVKLTRGLCGLDSDFDEPEFLPPPANDTIAFLRDHQVNLRDAPDPFFVNIGAMRFVATLATALAPGGGAYVSEYGEVARYPVASTQLDHLEFSIHFGQLAQVARHLGLETKVEYLHDLVGLDRSGRTLATTRTYFQNLRSMLASFDITLDKAAYTDAMFADLLGDQLDPETIGELRFDSVDERCMGLSPHEFKGLIVRRGAV